MKLLKYVLRVLIGIPCWIVGYYGLKRKKIGYLKYYWLSHYLIGDGGELWLPRWALEQDDTIIKERIIQRRNGYVVEASDVFTHCSLFYCIGRYVVYYKSHLRILHSRDTYNFHTYNESIFDSEIDEYSNVHIAIPSCVGHVAIQIQDICRYNSDIVDYILCSLICISYEITQDGIKQYELKLSDQIFEWLDGTPFITHIYFDYIV